MVTNKLFCQRLKNLRNERGLSQQALGDMVGLSKATISKYETGIHPPKIEQANALAKVFNVSFNYLIGLSEHRYIVETQHIVDLYEQLSDHRKQELYDYAEYLYGKEVNEHEGKQD